MALEEFNAADNKLKTVPKLDGLTSLTRLAIFNNNLVIMPPIKGLVKIQVVAHILMTPYTLNPKP